MKYSGAFKLDNCYIENDDWDRKQNTCVFDWIYYKYKNGECMKKLLKGEIDEVYERLNEKFKNYYKLDEHEPDEYDALRDGVI